VSPRTIEASASRLAPQQPQVLSSDRRKAQTAFIYLLNISIGNPQLSQFNAADTFFAYAMVGNLSLRWIKLRRKEHGARKQSMYDPYNGPSNWMADDMYGQTEWWFAPPVAFT